VLKQHTADGRLTLDEFGSRVEEALTAQTASQVRSVLRELPVPAMPPPRAPRPWAAVTPWLTLPTVLAAVLIGLAVWYFALWPLLIVAVLCFDMPRRPNRAHRAGPPRNVRPHPSA
jgi:hypothetical protein